MKRKTDNFNKFFNRKRTSAVKEEIRQEKKLVKKERREAVDRHFEEKRNKRAVAASASPESGKDQKKITANAKPAFNKKPAAPQDKDIVSAKNNIAAPQNNSATLPLNKYVAHA